MSSTVKLIAPQRRVRPDALAVADFADAPAPAPEGVAEALAAARARPEFSARAGAVTVVPRGSEKPRWLFVLGLGSRDELDASPLRRAGGRARRWAAELGVHRIGTALRPALEELLRPEAFAAALAEGLVLAGEQFTAHHGTSGRQPFPELELIPERGTRPGLERGLRFGEAANRARVWSATPPNVAHPGWVVAESRRVARTAGLRRSVIDAQTAARRGLGGLCAVGRGGSAPPALICLEHRPAASSEAPILLAGKTITFDSGGYSLKSSSGMAGMKLDKAGGMAVLAALEAVARAGIERRVVGLLPAAENLADARAYRPDDILQMANGVTVEVTNTDAEGRLVLADALALGCRLYRPGAVIDIATLTGGVVTALGSDAAGLFCGNPTLRDHLLAAGEATGERLWPLPLWESHTELLKSAHADVANAGERQATASQAAAFLSHFVPGHGRFAPAGPAVPWAHLDIAGVAGQREPSETHERGPTGFGTRLLLHAIETWPKSLVRRPDQRASG